MSILYFPETQQFYLNTENTSYVMEVYEGRLAHTGKDHHAEINAEGFHGKIGVIYALVCRTENPNQDIWKELYDDKCHRANDCFGNNTEM